MKKQTVITMLLSLIVINLSAQQAYPVTDQQPAMVNGLQIGYNIKSEETKKVSDKGDFSRYSVRFYVTNTTSEAKIMLYKEGWNLLGNSSDQLVQFNIINATGARLTSKEALISAAPCNVMALVDDRDAGNKIIHSRRFVQIGYWIRAGETFSTNAIVIVPLNEQPNVQAIYLAGQLQPTASASFANGNAMQQYGPPPPPPSMPLINSQGFLRLKNVSNKTYINVQTGPPGSTTIQNGWWSALWQLIPVSGTNFYNIKNKWKNNFIDTDKGYVVSSLNFANQTCMWALEPTRDVNLFRIKNAQTGGYLCIAQTGALILSNDARNNFSSVWGLEQP